MPVPHSSRTKHTSRTRQAPALIRCAGGSRKFLGKMMSKLEPVLRFRFAFCLHNFGWVSVSSATVAVFHPGLAAHRCSTFHIEMLQHPLVAARHGFTHTCPARVAARHCQSATLSGHTRFSGRRSTAHCASLGACAHRPAVRWQTPTSALAARGRRSRGAMLRASQEGATQPDEVQRGAACISVVLLQWTVT